MELGPATYRKNLFFPVATGRGGGRDPVATGSWGLSGHYGELATGRGAISFSGIVCASKQCLPSRAPPPPGAALHDLPVPHAAAHGHLLRPAAGRRYLHTHTSSRMDTGDGRATGAGEMEGGGGGDGGSGGQGRVGPAPAAPVPPDINSFLEDFSCGCDFDGIVKAGIDAWPLPPQSQLLAFVDGVPAADGDQRSGVLLKHDTDGADSGTLSPLFAVTNGKLAASWIELPNRPFLAPPKPEPGQLLRLMVAGAATNERRHGVHLIAVQYSLISLRTLHARALEWPAPTG